MLLFLTFINEFWQVNVNEKEVEKFVLCSRV